MEMNGNLIKARPCAPSIIRKEWYLVISKHVFMFKRMEEQGIFFYRNGIKLQFEFVAHDAQ